jgi:hypothetical protein
MDNKNKKYFDASVSVSVFTTIGHAFLLPGKDTTASLMGDETHRLSVFSISLLAQRIAM